MRRILGLLVVAALGVGAAGIAAPEAPPEPDFTGAVAPEPSAIARSSVWYCAWADSGDLRDSDYALASVPDVNALVSLPSPIPNEPARQTSVAIAGPGSAIVDVEDIVRLGAAPGFVEFDDGPATASALITSDFSLAGDHCVVSIDKVWYLPGGTTREGRQLTLRLFNPFSELAKVSVSGISEFGVVPLPELSPVDVPGRSFRDLELNPAVPFLDSIVLIVTTEQGSVVPALSLAAEGGDEATWPGEGLSATWEFPTVSTDGLVADLVIGNPSTLPVSVDIDVFTAGAASPDALQVEVSPDAPSRIPLTEIGEGAFGIRLRASGPVSAVVVAEDPPPPALDENDDEDEDAADEEPAGTRVAATTGARSQSTRWLLPGAGSPADAQSSVWVMNSNPESVTVTLAPLGSVGVSSDKLQIEPGRIARYNVNASAGITGYLIDASLPVTASWTAQSERGVVFVAGVVVGE
jgi:hypothetical protein